MKQKQFKKLALSLGLITSNMAYSQAPIGAPPTPFPAINAFQTQNLANNSWFRGGNNTANNANNIFGFSVNSTIWHRTNGFNRMLMFNGGAGQVNGRIGIGNNLPNTFTPVDRVHLFEAATTGFNGIRFSNTNTGLTNLDGSSVGIDNVTREFITTQFEIRPMIWKLPNTFTNNQQDEWMRLQHGLNTTPLIGTGGFSDGYLGLNEPNPSFHVDVKTPEYVGGELFFSGRPADVPLSRIGFCNGAFNAFDFLPMVFGNVDASIAGPGLQTLATIKTPQDIPTNPPVQRFMVGRDWNYNQTPVQNINEIINRPAFSWQNGSNIKMWMNARGQMRMGNLLNTNNPILNRFEIESQPTDTYGAFIGPGNFGASGLRLTNLTSANTVSTNPGTGVLSVDGQGNVILVPGGAGGLANNGLQISGGFTQLGGACTNTAEVLASQLLTDRKIPLNNFNLIFGENVGGTGRVGIGKNIVCTPGNQLEVNNGTLGNALSGLRLTDLAGAIPLPFNNQVLSVNPVNGDVILTNGPAPATNLGGLCGSGANLLATNWEIPLNNNNFIFGGQGPTNNNVGIGTTCAPIAKLDVLQNSGNFGSIGINVENQDAAGGTPGVTDVIGVKSLMSNPAPGCSQIAGWFEAVGGGGCVGAPQAHAIYVPQNGGGISIGYPNPAAVGFGSLLDVNGTISAAGITYPSDATLKNSVTNIANSLATIKKLRPVTYNWNTPLSQDMNGLHAGFIAQEVDTVLPHLVKTNAASGKKSVAYTELIPYLVKAIQQLEKQNYTQDSLITALTGSVNSCCSNSAVRLTGISGGVINQQNINLSDVDVIVLNQNTPNPFAEQTTITYNVPAKYKFAQMIFKTIEGKIIRTVDITTKGKGQLNVFASDLSAGLYVYSLIVDGEIIDTKKMVKE